MILKKNISKKLMQISIICFIALMQNGCVSSWLSIGESESPCDKNTKSLGKCVGITEVMKYKHKYKKEYLDKKEINDEE